MALGVRNADPVIAIGRIVAEPEIVKRMGAHVHARVPGPGMQRCPAGRVVAALELPGIEVTLVQSLGIEPIAVDNHAGAQILVDPLGHSGVAFPAGIHIAVPGVVGHIALENILGGCRTRDLYIAGPRSLVNAQ